MLDFMCSDSFASTLPYFMFNVYFACGGMDVLALDNHQSVSNRTTKQEKVRHKRYRPHANAQRRRGKHQEHRECNLN